LLDDDRLIVEVRRLAATNQRLPVLLLLDHVDQPARTRTITDKGIEIGFRVISKWNVTDILRAADGHNLVAQRPEGWRLLEDGKKALAAAGVQSSCRAKTPPSDSVLPRDLFARTRGYIEKVVSQINGSYDQEFYDCCAVMCRRLGETLIIEVYEAQNRAAAIKDSDDNFVMLSGLLSVLKKDGSVHLGRNAKRGLDGLKDLGDKAAHNRRFNARQADIDAIRSDFRTAAEELLHLAKLAT
jgi:hypothetical protein